MLFNSYVFLYAFLPVVLPGYYAAARFGRRPAMLWLIAVSFVFYGWWNPAFVPLLAVSITFNHGAARLIVAFARRPAVQRWLLRAAVGANLALLVHYKYAAWLTGLAVTAGLLRAPLHDAVLPLGISFFTFTQIGYLIDCRHGIVRSCGLLNYAAFVTFFPHLIAGPVLHHDEIMPQFADPATFRFSVEGFAAGLGIFILGLLKKCLLADPVGAAVPAAWVHPDSLPFFAAWRAVLSYSLQLYFDFSGYSDMALGLARMFNLRFPLNFDSPYKAQSVIDYWQRWHMTLTRWFMRYLYNPLAIAAMRGRMARRLPIDRRAQMTPRGFASLVAMPIFVTILLAGIWHGAGAQFLVFGLLHAGYLTINRACRIVRPPPEVPTRIGVVWRVALTYAAVLLASVFFRAPSPGAALSMLGGAAGLHGVESMPCAPDGVVRAMVCMLWLAGLYVIVWTMPNTQQIFAACRSTTGDIMPGPMAWLRWRSDTPRAIVMGGATALAALAAGGTSEFLYFQF